MKFSIKKLSILGLVTIFFVSAIMCCCFTHTVQAEEPTPSCHQTSQEKDSSKNTKDCHCDQSLTIAKKDVVFNTTIATIVTFVVEPYANNQIYVSQLAVAYQASLQYYDTAPLYIKHSVLRI